MTAIVDDGTRIERIALLEKVKAVAAAAQDAEIVAFARSQVAAQQTTRVNYRRLGEGIAEQVGLATKTSGWHGTRRLTLARDLIHELPQIFGLLAQGLVSEYVARLVATETSHLDADGRRMVDGQLVAQHVEALGPNDAAGLARRLAYAADPHGAVKRAVPTTYDNGRGVCERHNQVRELPGWRVETLTWGHGGQPYLIATTTPTGHTYLSRAPNPPITIRTGDSP